MTQKDAPFLESAQVDAEERLTLKIDSQAIDAHEQYIEQLCLQHNIQVKNALIVYLPSHSDPIIFVDENEINIGRQDRNGRIAPELDLSTYFEAVAQLGVSRLHAQIVWNGENYAIQDLHSTNHTWLNGQKLVPYHFYPLTDGSIVQFAQIAMTVFMVSR